MNRNFTTLTLAALAVLGAAQAASAQDAKQARFVFAPNIYAAEKANNPKSWDMVPTANVRAGTVPHNLLGLSPTMLQKPAPPHPVLAPIVHTSVTPAASFGQPVPTALVPKAPLAAFNPAFGNPLRAPAPGALPTQPQAATARPAPAKSIAAKPTKPVLVASNHVHARLSPVHLPPGRAAGPAKALPVIASYGKQGYDGSGPFLPTASSSSSSAKVSGRIVPRHR